MDPTWIPREVHGPAPPRAALPATAFAFPAERKEPLTDAGHVRAAIARFRQVRGVTDAERALAFANIRKAAAYYHVRLTVTSWTDLGARHLAPFPLVGEGGRRPDEGAPSD
jgi:hypothetical protein